MIGALLSGLFNLILGLVGTIIQIVLLPLNLLLQGVFPDFSTWVNNVVSGFNSIVSNLGWALSLIPPFIRDVLLLIFTIEIALIVIMKSTRATAVLWKLVQKLKFW